MARVFRVGIALLLLCAGMAVASAAGPQLTSRIDALVDKSDIGSGKLRFTLENRGAQSLFLLAWQTPFGGLDEDLFEVSRDGKLVDYVGRHYKRGAPIAADFLELRAGEARSVDVDLTAAYAMREAGQYEVAFHGEFSEVRVGQLDKRAGDGAFQAHSAAAFVWVDGAYVYRDPDASWLSLEKAGSVSFVGCNNTQANSVTTAVGGARSYSENAKGYLNAGTVGARYTTWFGSYTSSNYNSVKGNFVAIDDAMDNKPLAFYCDCTASAYAYVYPSDPYKVHLCNAFWSAPSTGTDSKAGTIIHEISHFNVVAGTNDNAYGQTACKKLALRSPRKAIDNADSHEYFAENKPAQN